MPLPDDTSAYLLRFNEIQNHLEYWNGKWSVLPASGGTPAAPTTSVQFNNAGVFGGSANLEWNNTAQTLNVLGKADGSTDFTSTALNINGGLVLNSITNAGPAFGATLAGIAIRDTHTEPALGPNSLVIRTPSMVIEPTPVGGGSGPWTLTVTPVPSVLIGDPVTKTAYVTNNTMEIIGNLYVGSPGTGSGVAAGPTNGIQVNGAVRLNGSTSGTVDIKASATPTTYVLTLPPNAGTNGQVLTTDGSATTTWTTVSGGGSSNVVQGTTTTDTTIHTTTFTSTTLTATITPSSNTKKVLVRMSGTVRFTANTASNQFAQLQIQRGATPIYTRGRAVGIGISTTVDSWIPYSMEFLDSPATTSATTYTLFAAGVNNTTIPQLEFQDNNDPAVVILTEV